MRYIEHSKEFEIEHVSTEKVPLLLSDFVHTTNCFIHKMGNLEHQDKII
ncbi:hypothetical protein MCW_01409 [Cardidatus Bartonella washoeensis 085-0475]|uniref:Uncharacterized protein n=1 Tax=Cardidatus Bartonella washoeensis 085-0475 TaxID=1094564 RepID=J1JG60_9HYPH|nr:hypothetical protein MCW_01409 [Bartonella washoeensis 085-0475]